MPAPRRTRGTGSVYYNEQRGRWQGEIPLVGPDGRTRSVTVTHRGPGPKAPGALAAKRACEKKLEAKKAELAKAGGKKTNTVLTVGKVLEDWAATTLETSRRTGARAPKTCNDYANTIRLHLIPRLGGIKLAQLRKSDIDRMVGAMLAAGYKPNSVRIARTVLGVVMRDAVRNGLLAANPVLDAEPVRTKKEKRTDTVFSAEEVGTILAAAEGDRLEALAAVILGTGLRRGEALGLRWDDVDFDAGTVRVDESLQWIEGQGLVFGAPKTAASVRPVTIPVFVVDALRRHRARQMKEQVAMGPDWADRSLVFATAIGTPLNPSNVTRWWKALLERAGVPHRRIHDGRHSVATALLNSGESIPNVSQHLGHSRESITVDVYGHASRDAGTRAAAALDAWVGSARRQEVTGADPH